MKNINRSLGQKKRKAKEGLAELIVNLLWTALKWTVFLPITLLFILPFTILNLSRIKRILYLQKIKFVMARFSESLIHVNKLVVNKEIIFLNSLNQSQSQL